MSLAILGAATPARAEFCRPARVVSPEAMPDAWRRSSDALVEATGSPNRPWSCPDADLVLEVDADGQSATLRLTTSRGKRERRLVAPEDLISTGKAWLSVLPPPEPPPSASPSPSPAANPAPDLETPRAALAAMIGPRFEAPTDAVWMAAELRAAAPIGPWSLGAWLRVATVIEVLVHTPHEFGMNEVVVGGFLERRFDAGPIELRAAFLPAISVVAMEGGETESQEVNGQKFDFRVGSRFGVARRITKTFRLTLDGEGELAPFGLKDTRSRHIHHVLSAVPSWGFGAGVGVEAWIH